jgi:hypothetical protein
MEFNDHNMIIKLRLKIKKIITLFEKEKEKCRILQNQNKDYEAQINNLKQEQEKLTIQYNNLKLAKSIESSGLSNHDAKLKVNTIVREIDKCIALLNK